MCVGGLWGGRSGKALQALLALRAVTRGPSRSLPACPSPAPPWSPPARPQVPVTFQPLERPARAPLPSSILCSGGDGGQDLLERGAWGPPQPRLLGCPGWEGKRPADGRRGAWGLWGASSPRRTGVPGWWGRRPGRTPVAGPETARGAAPLEGASRPVARSGALRSGEQGSKRPGRGKECLSLRVQIRKNAHLLLTPPHPPILGQGSGVRPASPAAGGSVKPPLCLICIWRC